jgi:hypothetical protein
VGLIRYRAFGTLGPQFGAHRINPELAFFQHIIDICAIFAALFCHNVLRTSHYGGGNSKKDILESPLKNRQEDCYEKYFYPVCDRFFDFFYRYAQF